MGKRFFILLSAFFILHFVVNLNGNAVTIASGIACWQEGNTAEKNMYAYAEKSQDTDPEASAPIEREVKKVKWRTRIWTKLFPFVLPEQPTIHFTCVAAFSHDVAGPVFSRYSNDLFISALRGPPASVRNI